MSGDSPIVDVQSSQKTVSLKRDVLDALPTSRTYAAEGSLAVGVKVVAQNVGGARIAAQQRLYVHGAAAADNTVSVDGMAMNSTYSNGETQPESQRLDDAGSHGADGVAWRRGLRRRVVHQPDSEGGREPHERVELRRLHRKRFSGQQPDPRADRQRPDDRRWGRVHLRLQCVDRRSDRPEQAVVLRVLSQRRQREHRRE